jgi:hypothetical protein
VLPFLAAMPSDVSNIPPRTLPLSGIRQRSPRLYSKNSNPASRECGTRRSSPATNELLAWAKARDFRERATEYLNYARLADDPKVQCRFIDIAWHYRKLARAEAQNARRMGDERRTQFR